MKFRDKVDVGEGIYPKTVLLCREREREIWFGYKLYTKVERFPSGKLKSAYFKVHKGDWFE